MTEKLVPTIATKPTLAQFAEAVLRAWPEATKGAAGVLYAHFAGETGGGIHCYGWNLGNVKHAAGDGHDYQALSGVFEYVNGNRVEVPATDPGAWFVVYPSLADGMIAFVDAKRNPKSRYASAWAPLVAGDVDAYAAALRAHGYYTAPLATYQRLMHVWFDSWMRSSAFENAQEAISSDDTLVVDQPIVHPLPGDENDIEDDS